MPLARNLRSGPALIVAICMTFSALTAFSGVGDRLDWMIDPLRAAAWIRPPSGQVVVVEMDAASIAAIRQWPWPRDHYARVIDRLRKAGAASITFDVDVSSPSTPAGDRAMAAALRRSDGLVALPTFAQQAHTDDARSLDALPLPAFRPYAALVSVSIQPDADGIVRRAPFGTVTRGLPRPAISSYIAHRSGTADAFFPIDFGLDPHRLHRLSFHAVERGAFDPGLVRGRDMLIGATAIEMGDRYATPLWGVMPGVIVQALAAETLTKGVPGSGSGLVTLLLAVVIGLAILKLRSLKLAALATVLAPIMLFAAAVWMQIVLHIIYPLAPALVFVAAISLIRGGIDVAGRFEQQRSVDDETGLPNRRALIRDTAAGSQRPIVVALIGNLDTLVTLLGDRAGHDLILRLADRMQLAVSSTVYRLTDRLLVFELVGQPEDMQEHFAALRAVLTQPVEILGRRTDAAVHLGMADDRSSIHDRLANATRAANEAAARGRFWQHSDVDIDLLERRLVLMGELDHAITSGQIEVHYQPKLDLATDRITSVEALVRWRHPTRGMVRPDLFIPLAEQSDRIESLTLFVLQTVARDLFAWRQQGVTITAAVNLSAMLIAADSFHAAVEAILQRSRILPTDLIFEITESAALVDPQGAASNLRQFRDQGIAISMDDYGTGQSTLSYLRQLPLSELKIDRSFVQHAHLNRSDELMVRSTINLAHDLGLKVVAEGIEEQACLEFLKDAQCDTAQGYLIGKPLPASDLIENVLRCALAA